MRSQQDRGKFSVNSDENSRSRSRSPSLRNKGSKQVDDKSRRDNYSKKYESSDTRNPEPKFVWGKKLEEMKKKGIATDNVFQDDEREKEEKTSKEIEKLRKRIIEREREKKMQTQEKQQVEEEESYQKWLEKEEQFHIEQAKMRSEIRIQQGREQAVDYLVKILLIHRGKFDYDPSQEREIRKPYILLGRLTTEELVQLQNDIKEQTKIELNDYYKQFWDEITILVDEKLHAPDPRNVSSKHHRTSSIGPEFENEVNEMIGDKSYKELIELENEINQTLDNPTEFKIDVEYWENVLKKLRVRKAKAFLEEMGDKFLENYKKGATESRKPLSSVKINSGELSPRLLDFERKFEGMTITLAEDIEALNEERGNILVNELQKIMNNGKGEHSTLKRKESKDGKEGLELEDEEEENDVTDTKKVREEQEFNELVNVAEQHYDWVDQYAPRKPQYFNRVKVGYEWNKYNQTHYDQDNPPPKTVQGYKFNLFYPDLIDPTKAPEFHLEATDNPEFCIMRFHAGAPYEDVAFKILNREWDFSDKQGFKCIFEHNILHLYFNFRKTRYRR